MKNNKYNLQVIVVSILTVISIGGVLLLFGIHYASEEGIMMIFSKEVLVIYITLVVISAVIGTILTISIRKVEKQAETKEQEQETRSIIKNIKKQLEVSGLTDGEISKRIDYLEQQSHFEVREIEKEMDKDIREHSKKSINEKNFFSPLEKKRE